MISGACIGFAERGPQCISFFTEDAVIGIPCPLRYVDIPKLGHGKRKPLRVHEEKAFARTKEGAVPPGGIAQIHPRLIQDPQNGIGLDGHLACPMVRCAAALQCGCAILRQEGFRTQDHAKPPRDAEKESRAAGNRHREQKHGPSFFRTQFHFQDT